LGGLQLGQYTYLQPVVNFFSQTYANDHISFANTSLAAWSGWTSADLLNPERVFSSTCQPGESPLVCEYRVTKPSVALIMIGTNDVYFGMDSATYRANLDTIVKTSINMGVIPVLSTIPDNLQDPNLATRIQEFNGIIASVASANSIPLWNYWQAMQGLNNHGISGDGYHPSTSPTGEAAVFTPDALQYGFNIRNLTALMVLDAVWRGALY
jgi:lysophospholipase L1-like esterase